MSLEIDFLSHRPEHDETVAQWYHDFWWHRDGSMQDSLERLRSQLFVDRLPLTLVATFDGKPCGAAAIWENDHDVRKDLTPWFAVLYVPPLYRGRGIATQLIQRRILIARSMGYEKAFIWADHSVWPFHQNQGWEPYDYEQRIMTRRLW